MLELLKTGLSTEFSTLCLKLGGKLKISFTYGIIRKIPQ
jgi:hypothetical protein